MSTLAEIEKAIETLPAAQVDELAAWLEKRRQQPARPVPPPAAHPRDQRGRVPDAA
jgi:hypothetical protein